MNSNRNNSQYSKTRINSKPNNFQVNKKNSKIKLKAVKELLFQKNFEKKI